ncbi:MAG: lnt [Nitrospirae bacterium]|nr:lnt [Nitrospirota bacterium]
MENANLKKLYDYLPAIVSGVLIVLAFPVFDLYPLAWVALIPLLLSLWKKTPGEALQTGFVFGIVYFFGTLYWIYHSIHFYGGVSFVASIAIVILLCCYLSMYTAVFAYVFSSFIKKTKLPMLLIGPVLWVVLEFIRSYAFTGFPWSSIGYSQYKFLPIIQVSDITGVYGISFLVVAFNCAIVDALLIKSRIRQMPLFPLSYTILGFFTLLIIIASSLGYGFWRLGQERPGHMVRASVVQGNIEQDKKWEPAFQKYVMDTYSSLSLEAVKGSPDLIVWPETAIPFFFGADTANTEYFVRFQKTLSTYLLFGSVLTKKTSADQQFLTNSVLLLDKEGKISYRYDKIHMVPFGEYVPLRSVLFFIDKLVAGIGDYLPGNQYIKAETKFGGFASLICYEIIFPGLVRKFYAKDGDFIVNITNDAWFGKTAGPYQHFSMAVFRAIENRKPLMRSANTGISGFIDSNGRIVSTTELFQRQVLSEEIKTDNTLSMYSRYGDLFMYFCMVISVMLFINLKSWR